MVADLQFKLGDEKLTYGDGRKKETVSYYTTITFDIPRQFIKDFQTTEDLEYTSNKHKAKVKAKEEKEDNAKIC